MIVASKVDTKTAGCLPDSLGILATMYINKGDKEQRKAAVVQSKYNQMKIIYIYTAKKGMFHVFITNHNCIEWQSSNHFSEINP